MSFQHDGFQHDGFQTGLEGGASAAAPVIPALFSLPWKSTADQGEMASPRYRTQEAPLNADLFGMPAVVWKTVPALIAANLLLTTLATAPAPVQARTFDLPAKTFVQPVFSPPNLLLSTLASAPPPFVSRASEAARAVIASPAFSPPNLLETTLAAAPFVGGTTGAIRVTVSVPSFVPPNLLESTLSLQQGELPFRKLDWPLPPRIEIDVGEIFTRTQPDQAVAGEPPFTPQLFPLPPPKPLTRMPVVFRPAPEDQQFAGQAYLFNLPPFIRSQPDFKAPNLLESTLAGPVIAPFTPVSWILPPFVRSQPGFTPPDLLLSTLGLPAGEKPFGQQNFPLPYFDVVDRIQLGWNWTIQPDLLPPAVTPTVDEGGQKPAGKSKKKKYERKKLKKYIEEAYPEEEITVEVKRVVGTPKPRYIFKNAERTLQKTIEAINSYGKVVESDNVSEESLRKRLQALREDEEILLLL